MNKNHPKTSDDQSGAAQLLADFIADGRSEASFQRLVDRLGKLVFSRALRQTGDASLAEEVTQNVFTMIAQKATALQNHPALIAWIFKTTRFAVSKALLAERRRQRKHDAFAADAQATSDQISNMQATTDNESWRDAAEHLDGSLDQLGTKDREVVLQRFYEGRKFADIAILNGTTEAASKMRLKRALEKLSGILGARGVALSTTVIASTLGTELAKAAPVSAASNLAATAVAAPVTGTALITLTTTTAKIMPTVKSVTATGTAIIALAATPFFLQQSKGSKLQDELSDLQARHTAMQQNGQLVSAELGTTTASNRSRTVKDLLARPGETDISVLIDSIINGLIVSGGNSFDMLPLARLNGAQVEQLIAELKSHPGDPQLVETVLAAVNHLAPVETPATQIEGLLEAGAEVHSYSVLLGRWAEKDPEAALAWFKEKEASNELLGTAITDKTRESLLNKLFAGIARTDPGRAIDFLFETGADNKSALNAIGIGIGQRFAKDGDAVELKNLLARIEKPTSHQALTDATRRAAVARDDFAAAVSFARAIAVDPSDQDLIIATHIAESGLMFRGGNVGTMGEKMVGIDKQLKAAQNHVSEASIDQAFKTILATVAKENEEGVLEWTEQQSSSKNKDFGWMAMTEGYHNRYSFKMAMTASENISDPERQAEAQLSAATAWMRMDKKSARAALPAQLAKDAEASINQ